MEHGGMGVWADEIAHRGEHLGEHADRIAFGEWIYGLDDPPGQSVQGFAGEDWPQFFTGQSVQIGGRCPSASDVVVGPELNHASTSAGSFTMRTRAPRASRASANAKAPART